MCDDMSMKMLGLSVAPALEHGVGVREARDGIRDARRIGWVRLE
jgi:hypothetical protein